MKPEEMRVKIAKLCPYVARIDGAGVPVWIKDSHIEFDPLEDLNAMHEAEKVLTEEQRTVYVNHVYLSVPLLFDLLHATALQRAEAFLKTIGQREPEKLSDGVTQSPPSP